MLDTYLESKTLADMPYMIAEDNRVEKVNELFLNLTGYEEKDILEREVEEVWQQLLRISMDPSKVKCSHECDCYMFDVNRTVKEVTIGYSEAIESNRDIYTFKQKKNSLFDEKYPFLEQVNSSNDTGVALYSIPDFTLLKANKSYLKYFSKRYKNLKDILGLTLEVLIPSWKNSEVYDTCLNVVKSGQSVFFNEQLNEFRELGSFYTRYTLTPIFEEGKVKCIVQIHNDVTEKVMHRDAVDEKNRIIEEQKNSLKKQRDYLYKLFNFLDLPILYLTYPDLKVIELNKKAASELKELTGLGDEIIKSHIIGRSVSEVAPAMKNYGESVFLEQMGRTKSTICHEKMEVKKNGHRIYYNITYQPIFNVGGEVSELLVVAVDVTAEVEKRNQIEDALKLKDEFLYLMSHEFKTPLTVINAAVQSLEYCYSSQIPDKARVLIARIKQNAFRQLRLVNNLLDITRINAGQIKLKKRNVDIVLLTRVITESVAIYAQQKGVEIIFTSKLQQKVIGIDDEKFERILLNLLSNAIKFTPTGKKIVVDLSTKLNKNKRMVCIKVKDQGIGIPKDKHNLIFEQFGQVDSTLTRQAEGTGIGLFLVKLMVNACKGEIYVESEEGKGSVFVLMLPLNKADEDIGEQEIKHISDSRLVQSLATEFSDIYL